MTRLRKFELSRASVLLFESLTLLRSDKVRLEVLLFCSVELSREVRLDKVELFVGFGVEVETWVLLGVEASLSLAVELIKSVEFRIEPGVGNGKEVWWREKNVFKLYLLFSARILTSVL